MEKLREIIEKNNITSIFRTVDLYNSLYKKEEINEMLKEEVVKKNIILMKDDIYILGKMWRKELVTDELLAQMLVPESYVSMEFVLSQAAWIPEAVYAVTCVITEDRKRTINTEIKKFKYVYIPQKKYKAGVNRYDEGKYKYYKAKPLKALSDIICKRQEEWTALAPLHESYRIEYEDLEMLKSEDFDELHGAYGVSNVENFLEGIRKELRL
jgi:hypothetical protein